VGRIFLKVLQTCPPVCYLADVVDARQSRAAVPVRKKLCCCSRSGVRAETLVQECCCGSKRSEQMRLCRQALYPSAFWSGRSGVRSLPAFTVIKLGPYYRQRALPTALSNSSIPLVLLYSLLLH
jgi:hypothetical protein